MSPAQPPDAEKPHPVGRDQIRTAPGRDRRSTASHGRSTSKAKLSAFTRQGKQPLASMTVRAHSAGSNTLIEIRGESKDTPNFMQPLTHKQRKTGSAGFLLDDDNILGHHRRDTAERRRAVDREWMLNTEGNLKSRCHSTQRFRRCPRGPLEKRGGLGRVDLKGKKKQKGKKQKRLPAGDDSPGSKLGFSRL